MPEVKETDMIRSVGVVLLLSVLACGFVFCFPLSLVPADESYGSSRDMERHLNEVDRRLQRTDQALQEVQKQIATINESGTTGSRIMIAGLKSEIAGLRSVGDEIVRGLFGLTCLIVTAILGWIWRTLRVAATLRVAEQRLLERHEMTNEAIKEATQKAQAAYREANHVNAKLQALGYNKEESAKVAHSGE